MSAREAIIEAADSEPFRSLLLRLAKSNAGVRFLNKLSYPRAVFSSFDEAWVAARKTAYAGHDHPDYIKLHLELSKTLRPSDYAALYWISRICSREIKVFDFGGHVGNLFYSYLDYLIDTSNSKPSPLGRSWPGKGARAGWSSPLRWISIRATKSC